MGILYADYFLFSMFDDDLDITNKQIFFFHYMLWGGFAESGDIVYNIILYVTVKVMAWSYKASMKTGHSVFNVGLKGLNIFFSL